MQWDACLLIVVAVLILAGATLLAPRLRRRPPVPPVPAPERVPEAAPQEPVTEAPPVVELERPEPTAGRLVRLRARLSRSQSVLGRGLLAVLARDRLDDEAWEKVEEAPITADVGVEATRWIVRRLRERTPAPGTRRATDLRTLLTEELVAALDPKLDRALSATPHDGRPAVLPA